VHVAGSNQHRKRTSTSAVECLVNSNRGKAIDADGGSELGRRILAPGRRSRTCAAVPRQPCAPEHLNVRTSWSGLQPLDERPEGLVLGRPAPGPFGLGCGAAVTRCGLRARHEGHLPPGRFGAGCGQRLPQLLLDAPNRALTEPVRLGHLAPGYDLPTAASPPPSYHLHIIRAVPSRAPLSSPCTNAIRPRSVSRAAHQPPVT
jgi:hypothetical protein